MLRVWMVSDVLLRLPCHAAARAMPREEASGVVSREDDREVVIEDLEVFNWSVRRLLRLLIVEVVAGRAASIPK